MKQLNIFVSGLAMAAVALGVPAAQASESGVRQAVNLSKVMSRMAPERGGFQSTHSLKANSLNEKFLGSSRAHRITLDDDFTVEPTLTKGPTTVFFDIDGPNGQLWYGTTELISDVIKHEWFNEYVLREYKFTIFDSQFNVVGTVHDKMRYEPGEVRVPGPEAGISLLPSVTSRYFNDDDKYEVVVSIAVNTETPGLNHYRSIVYSLNGEKETVKMLHEGVETDVEVDKPVRQYQGFINDVLVVGEGADEQVYMTFAGEYSPGINIDYGKLADGDKEEGKKYWESVSGSGFNIRTYGKADAEGNLKLVFQGSISYQNLQGDMESSPYVMTLEHNGEGYLLFPHYKETFFNPHYSPYEDMTPRENNCLVVELYKLTPTGSDKVSETEISVKKASGAGILASYYSVGDMRYTRDVEFKEDGSVQYVVTRSNYTTYSDESTGFCYYKYDVDGNRLFTIFEDAEAYLPLTSCPGHNDQVLFVIYDDDEGYVSNFVDLSVGYDKKKTVKIANLIDTGFGDLELMSFNADLVPMGDTYKYAFEMRSPLVDENDNDFIRIAWFDADGKFDRIDHVNMGTSVNYAQVYIDGTVLNPTLIYPDATPEYLVLIKRGLSEGQVKSQEELIIAQPTDEWLEGGKTILHLTPSEKGALREISLYPGIDENDYSLLVLYIGQQGYTVDFYALPLVLSSIDDIAAAPADGSLSFDGKELTADGSISVYDTTGRLVATARGSLDAASLPAGLYIAVSGKTIGKFLVK